MIRVVIGLLALVGVWVAAAMYRQGLQASAGRLPEPSIVERPEARLFFGLPNAALGLIYYDLVLAALIFGGSALLDTAAVASVGALGTSIYLAIKLVRQRLECSRCWTAHAVNALLCPLLVVSVVLAR